MPYLDEHTLATKARGVLFHQLTLLKMRQHPEQVESVSVDKVGRVTVLFKTGEEEQIGFLNDQYWARFKYMTIKAFTVTGGKPMPEYQLQHADGLRSQRLTNFGCNLTIALQ